MYFLFFFHEKPKKNSLSNIYPWRESLPTSKPREINLPLNVFKNRLTNISEMDLFSQAFAFLSLNTKQEDLFEPLSEKGETSLLLYHTPYTFLTSYLNCYENKIKFYI